MLKRLILIISAGMLFSGSAMTVYSAETRKIRPGEVRQLPSQAEQTPQKITTKHIPRPKPDLTITAIQISPANPKKGQLVRFTAKVVNKGLVSSAWTQCGVRVGGETTPQAHSIPALAPNVEHTITRHQTISKAGRFRVTFIADLNGTVAETKENNNARYKDFTVQDVLPDLTVVNPRVVPANPTVNDQIRLTATLNNIGDIPSGAFRTGVRIGGESQPKDAGFTGHLDVTSPQSQQYVVARLWNTARPGKYVVEFFVDTEDDVSEHNEQNNATQFVITVGP